MKKVMPVYTTIALLSLLIVSQAISIVSANPWSFSTQIDPPSGAVPPIISILFHKTTLSTQGNLISALA